MTTPTVDYVAKNEKLLMHKHKFTDMKGQLDLATQVTGILTVANGGTGLTTFSAGQVLFGPLLQSSNLYWDNTNKRLGLGTSSVSAHLHVKSANASDIQLLIQGASSGQTADYLQFKDSTGAIGAKFQPISGAARLLIASTGDALARFGVLDSTYNSFYYYFDGAGTMHWADGAHPNGDISLLRNSGSGLLLQKENWADATTPVLTIRTTFAGNSGLIVRGAAAQTANLQEWQNTGGTALVAITSAGYLGIGISSSLSAPLHVKSTSQAVYVGDNASTSTVYCQFQNAGGRFYAGVDNSTGTGLWTGGIAYASSFGTGNSTAFQIATNNTVRLSLAADGSSLTYSDAVNIAVGTTTGTKIGTATSQKISLWNATPIVQPTTAGAASTLVVNTSGIANDTATFDGYTIGQVVKALRNIGALA